MVSVFAWSVPDIEGGLIFLLRRVKKFKDDYAAHNEQYKRLKQFESDRVCMRHVPVIPAYLCTLNIVLPPVIESGDDQSGTVLRSFAVIHEPRPSTLSIVLYKLPLRSPALKPTLGITLRILTLPRLLGCFIVDTRLDHTERFRAHGRGWRLESLLLPSG